MTGIRGYRLGATVQGYVEQSVYQENLQGYNVLSYGAYNTYPQECDFALSRSSIAKSCVQTLAEFIFGEGFLSELTANAIVNDESETMNEILWQAVKDYSRYRGFALLLNANVLGEYTSIQNYPFTHVRLGLANEDGQYDHVRCWDNWAMESPRSYANFNEIKTKPIFNPSELKSQIEKAGGISKFGGQIYYFSDNQSYSPYPFSTFHSAMKEVLISGNLPDFVYNYTKNGFSSSAIIVNPEVGSPEQSEANARQISKMGGIREAGAIQYFEGADLKLLDLSATQGIDKEFTVINENNDSRIIRSFQMPDILLGSSRQGGFPNQDEMSEATKYYNAKTRMFRKAISKPFSEIAKHFVYSLGNDFTIKETDYNKENNWEGEGDNASIDQNTDFEAKAKAELRGSVGGVQGILQIADSFQRGVVSEEASRAVLREIYGFSSNVISELLAQDTTTKEVQKIKVQDQKQNGDA